MLCFMAGANSIFFGDKLLTIHNPEADADLQMLADAGLSTLPAADSDLPPQPVVMRQRAEEPQRERHASLPLAK
jgi:biotin synthase